ncbi:MAG: TetR/AcrR family transcriptional regulator [Gordonia sp. (in: high G+C Gram-positive bacteria)]
MTSRTGRRARPEDRRRQLIDAAAALFGERGYPHVSVTDIARCAGVSTPTLYRHFGDKRALLVAAVQEQVDQFEACTDRALNEIDDPVEAIVAVATRLTVARPHTNSLWRWSGQYLTPEEDREVVQRTRAVLRRWAVGIAASRAPEVTERESMYLAGAVLSVIDSFAGRRRGLSNDELVAQIRALTLRVLALTPADATPLEAQPVVDDTLPDRRDEILDAAAAQFAQRGFSSTGMDDIGAAVGITGPSVYKHFPSKDAILVAIGQRSALRLEAGAMAARARTADPAALLGLLVESYVDTMTSSPDLQVALNSGYSMSGNPHAADLLASQRRYVRRWVELLQQADASTTPQTATLTVHCALAIVNDAVRMPRRTGLPQFAARMAYLMKGLLGV